MFQCMMMKGSRSEENVEQKDVSQREILKNVLEKHAQKNIRREIQKNVQKEDIKLVKYKINYCLYLHI